MADETMESEGMPKPPSKPAREVKGSEAAAILMLLLDDSEAGEILKHFDPDEMKQIGQPY